MGMGEGSCGLCDVAAEYPDSAVRSWTGKHLHENRVMPLYNRGWFVIRNTTWIGWRVETYLTVHAKKKGLEWK